MKVEPSSPRGPGDRAPHSDSRRRKELRRALLDYYDRTARALPWRGESDPYRILVSEVMLQRTRVETVKRYYGRWLERFPDLESLADADEDEVMKAWEGLGYYRRARNLHRAVRVVRETAAAILPSAHADLQALPGVGEYTAGAVASIAFGEVAPAVDGNVRRVLSRLFDARDPEGPWLREVAQTLVDPERPGDWNQALMELGATVCTLRNPGLGTCPVRDWCAARAAGTQLQRPGAKEKRYVRNVHVTLGIFHSEGRLLLVKRPPEGLLGGMWAFPERDVAVPHDAVRPQAALGPCEEAVALATELGLEAIGAPEQLPLREHRFTHLHVVYIPWAVDVVGALDGAGRVWIGPLEAGELSLPVAQRRVLESWRAQRMVT